MKKILSGAAFAALTVASPASAATPVFFEDFEAVELRTGVLVNTSGTGFKTVNSAGPWKAGARGIELQHGSVAGAPAADGGRVFVELDTSGNSSMFYTLKDSGKFTFDFLFSPRPGQNADSNQIQLLIGGTSLGIFTGPVTGTLGATSWTPHSVSFTGWKGQNLILKAIGLSNSKGGYIDNTRLRMTAAIPEPGTWMLMILGLGAVGFAMRRQQKSAVRLQFA